MKIWKILVLTTLFVFWVSPVIAKGPNPPEADVRAVTEVEEVETAEAIVGSCSGCSGWIWGRAEEAWRYVSGSEERIWLYFRTTKPYYAYINTGDARHIMFLQAAASGHYIGTYWLSSSSASNVRLWYY